MDELTSAIVKLKKGKAGGAFAVLSEMVKAGYSVDALLEKILNLVQTSWMERRVLKLERLVRCHTCTYSKKGQPA